MTLDDPVIRTESDVNFVSAADSPGVSEAAVQAAMSGTDVKTPTLENPLDGPVILPGGYRRLEPGTPPKFTVHTKAWVKELDGYAEEKIARARLKGDMDAFLSAILEAGVERIGDFTPTPQDLRDLFAGDREFLLLEISRATYGELIEFANVLCPGCGELLDGDLTKSDQIPVHRLKNHNEAYFVHKTRQGRELNVHVPTVEEQARAFNQETDAESSTVLLSHIIEEFRGEEDEARSLSLKDRTQILAEVNRRAPGPRYNEVSFPHEPGCGAEVGLSVTLALLFPGM